MKVTFTKTDSAGASTTVAGPKSPTVVPRQAGGSDAYLPAELVQFVVEEEFGIRLGVFGQIAAGGDGAPGTARDRSGRRARAAHRGIEAGRADVARSERLVALCRSLWEARAGRTPSRPAVIDMTLATPFDVDRVIHRLDEVSAEWVALAPGESVAMEWPAELVVYATASGR